MLRFQRSGVDGQLTLAHKEVVIEAQLGFLLAMMKPRIEQSIHENLDTIFGEEKKPKKCGKGARSNCVVSHFTPELKCELLQKMKMMNPKVALKN